jgi:hypothetical protein
LELPLPFNSPLLEPSQGILEEIVSPWNEFRLALVVSGLDEEGVLKASYALNRQANFLGMRGPIAIVVDLLDLTEAENANKTTLTLNSLGYDDQTIYGSKLKSYRLYFYLPLGWQLEETPFFVLKFTHSDIVDPEESTVNIKLNNTPISSIMLNDDNVIGEVPFALPTRLLKTGSNAIDIVVEMTHPDQDVCNHLNNQQLWTVISNESEIVLPYSTIDLDPNLLYFPHPFNHLGLEQTLFVLPDQTIPSMFNDLMKLAVRLGSGSGTGQISIEVAYASAVDDTAKRNSQIILLGRPTENALLREINAYLPQPFQSNSDTLEIFVIDSVAFVPDPDRDAGLLEIIDAPWDEEYRVLAITGTTDKGVNLAIQTLLEQTDRLDGNLAVVESVFDPFADVDEPPQVTIYATDTLPSSSMPVDNSVANIGNTVSGDNLSALADRWWK